MTTVDLATHHVEVLSRLGRPRSWPAGTTLWQTGDSSTEALLIRSGQVKITISAVSGKQMVLAVRGAGELIGEFSALDGRGRSASTTTITPVTGVMIAGDALLGCLGEHADLTLALLRLVISRIRESDLRRLDLGVMDSTSRAAGLLIDLAERHGRIDTDGTSVLIELT
jgi:CRP/FNR family transcriptional regulator, cyclic AMP receptor protein